MLDLIMIVVVLAFGSAIECVMEWMKRDRKIVSPISNEQLHRMAQSVYHINEASLTRR